MTLRIPAKVLKVVKLENFQRNIFEKFVFPQKCYYTCWHTILYDMTFSTGKQRRHMINTFFFKL